MLTNIVAIGKIGAAIRPNMRLLHVERPHRDADGTFVTDAIPIAYWSRSVNNYFMTMKEGTAIFVKGHLESWPDIGLAIITDYLETLVAP